MLHHKITHWLMLSALASAWSNAYVLLEFPHTKIADNLPANLVAELPQIINYRFGILPDSDMLTVEVRGHVAPGKIYEFTPGALSQKPSGTPTVHLPATSAVPQHVEFVGQWSNAHSSARIEANVLGEFGTLTIDQSVLAVPLETAHSDMLAYYNALLIRDHESFLVESPKDLPITVVSFGANYAQGYLSLPEHGGGYYLETHDLPHFWSHLQKEARGALLLGKEVRPGVYHLTAFRIPFGTGVYVPGGVIHCDGLLVGDVMPIYSVTPNFSTVHLKTPQSQVVHITLHSAATAG